MTNPADQVIAGLMDFSGGDETGRLTAGYPHPEPQSGRHRPHLVPRRRQPPGGARRALEQHGDLREPRQLPVPGAGHHPRLRALTLGSNVTVAGQLISLPLGQRSDDYRHRLPSPPAAPTYGPQRLHRPHLRRRAAGALRRRHRRLQPSHLPEPEPDRHRADGQQRRPAARRSLSANLNFTTALSPADSTWWPTTSMAPRPTRSRSTSSAPAGLGRRREPGQQRRGHQLAAAGNSSPGTARRHSNWFNPANWDRNAVPGVIDDVVLVPITNQPVLTTNAADQQPHLHPGSILDLGGFVLAAAASWTWRGRSTTGSAAGG